jgi:hypothetical protein
VGDLAGAGLGAGAGDAGGPEWEKREVEKRLGRKL